jgi:SAM-dependent methyltransferase
MIGSEIAVRSAQSLEHSALNRPGCAERLDCRMAFIGWLLAAFVLFQVGIRVFLRLRPQPIPYGWSWLLENPWRRRYRHPERTVERLGLKPTDTVLELGCGSGLFTRAIAACCAHLIAADIEPQYLAETKAKSAGVTNLEYLRSDAAILPLESDSVDVIVLISTLPEVPDPVRALRECLRVLKPQGRIVVSEELFEPEYVSPAVIERWASEAGLKRVKQDGDFWVYFSHFEPASENATHS